MLKIWRSVRGVVTGVIAFIFCPCHLPLTLPLVISLTAGTAWSTWLVAPRNALLVGAISTVIFTGGMVLAFQWMGDAQTASSRPGLSKAIHTSTACLPCEEALEVATEHPLRAPVPKASFNRRPGDSSDAQDHQSFNHDLS